MEPHSSTSKKVVFKQQHQTVFGNQFNIGGNIEGNLNVQLPPLEPSRAVPPAPPTDFVGRTEQLTQLAAILTSGRSAAITALYGMGGIGKTALAQQLTEQLTDYFTGGIFWGGLAEHNGSAEAILRTWGAICGVEFSQEPNPAVLSDRVRGLLRMRHDARGSLLVVLDDVRKEWRETTQLLKKSLPANTPLLLTMRDVDLAISLDAEIVPLDVLPENDAHELLAVCVKPKEILTPEATVQSLLRHLGYLPLAIRLAAGHMSKFAHKPGFDLNQFVEDVAHRALSLLNVPGSSGLAATFAISYDALDIEQQRIFRYCSVYSAAFLTVEHMSGLLGLDPTSVNERLDELVNVALLDWVRERPGQYILHPLLRQYGYELLQRIDKAHDIHKHAALYLRNKFTYEGSPAGERLEEIAQWEKSQTWTTFIQRTIHVIDSIIHHLGHQSITDHLQEMATYLEHAQEIAGSTTEISILEKTNLWRTRASLSYIQANWENTIHYLGIVLELYEQTHNIGGIASIHSTLGTVFFNLSNMTSASNCYEKSLSLYEKLGDLRGKGRTLFHLGTVHIKRKEWKGAILVFEQALRIFEHLDEQVENQEYVVSLFQLIAEACQNINNWEKASTCYEQLLLVCEKSSTSVDKGETLINLGSCYAYQGEWQKALHIYESAYEFYIQLENPNRMAQVFQGLGAALQNLDDWERAIDVYRQALNLYEQQNDWEKKIEVAANLISGYLSRQEWNQVIKLYEQFSPTIQKFDSSQPIVQLHSQYQFALSQRGETHRVKGKYEEALADFDHALELSPDDQRILALRGEIHRYFNRHSEALTDLNRSLDLNPGDQWALTVRGRTYSAMSDYGNALADFNHALSIMPDHPTLLVYRAETYCQMKAFEEALADLNTALALNPGYIEAFNKRNEVFSLIADQSKRLKILEQIVEQNSEDQWALAQRGEIYRVQGRHIEALSNLDHAIRLNPSDTWAMAVRGHTYREIGRYQEALTDFENILATNPNYEWVVNQKEQLNQLFVQPEQLLEDIDKILSRYPMYPWAWLLRGSLRALNSALEMALSDIDRALEIAPDFALALIVRGELFLRLEQYANALVDLNRGLTLAPDSVEGLSTRGYVHFSVDQLEMALADFDHALDLKPNFTLALKGRAFVYYELKQYKKAFEDCQQILMAEPDDIAILLVRGKAQLFLGMYDEAKLDIDRVLEVEVNDWYLFIRGLVDLVQARKQEADSFFSRALSLAEAEYQENSTDVRIAFNLALYSLARNDHDRADMILRETIDKDVSMDELKTSISDLEDYIRLFPDSIHATNNLSKLRDVYLQELAEK